MVLLFFVIEVVSLIVCVLCNPTPASCNSTVTQNNFSKSLLNRKTNISGQNTGVVTEFVPYIS